MMFRSSCLRCSMKKAALKVFTKSEKTRVSLSLFFNKVATVLKKRLWYRCFPVNFLEFFRNIFYKTPPGDCFW